MIEQAMKDINGKTVTLFTPENEKDIEELKRREDAGNLDTRESFADDPEAWTKSK